MSLDAVGRVGVRHPGRVLFAALLLAVVGGAFSSHVTQRLSVAGFDDPSSPSTRAANILQHRFGVTVPNLILLVSTRHGIDQPSVAREATALTRRLAREPGVDRVASYWNGGSQARTLRAQGGGSALIAAQLQAKEDQVYHRAEAILPRYIGRHGPVTVSAGGLSAVIVDTHVEVTKDLQRIEVIALPVTLVALVFVFGSVVAALLPLVVGILSIVGTMLILQVLSEVTQVSVFALNLTTALGLGLAVDYSLFIVARYRIERTRQVSTEEAIAVTMRTAGRAIAFSAAIVAVALSALLVFPMYYLRSFAYAGVPAVLLALVAALVVVPALLTAIGPRIDSLSLRCPGRRASGDRGFWYRFSTLVMRRPLPVAVASVAFLLALGSPFLRASLALSDDRDLPASVQAREVGDTLRAHYPIRPDATTFVVARSSGTRPPPVPKLDRYAARLSLISDVVAVDGPAGTFKRGRRIGPPPVPRVVGKLASGADTWLEVQSGAEPLSGRGTAIARAIRDVRAGFSTLVTSQAADAIDTSHAVASRLPLTLLLVGITTFVVLLLMTGSVLIAVKALTLSALSLTAVFGAMVFIFQEGHLGWLVGNFTVTGSINVLNPPLVFCIAFGLAMDYEVFMLSRVKEEHDRGAGDRTAVALGLQRTGPVITAAAAVMAVVFVSYATSAITSVKLIGVGLAVAVIVDVTVVRATLVPAVMRLSGRLNWWQPALLRRRHERLGAGDDVSGDPLPAAGLIAE